MNEVSTKTQGKSLDGRNRSDTAYKAGAYFVTPETYT